MQKEIKKFYLEMLSEMLGCGVFVYDSSIHGVGMAFNFGASNHKRLICVDGSISWKNKMFVLLHEIGHLFYIDINGNLRYRRTNAGELGANRTAVKLLDEVFPELIEEYASYYNKMNKSKPRKKFVVDKSRRS